MADVIDLVSSDDEEAIAPPPSAADARARPPSCYVCEGRSPDEACASCGCRTHTGCLDAWLSVQIEARKEQHVRGEDTGLYRGLCPECKGHVSTFSLASGAPTVRPDFGFSLDFVRSGGAGGAVAAPDLHAQMASRLDRFRFGRGRR